MSYRDLVYGLTNIFTNILDIGLGLFQYCGHVRDRNLDYDHGRYLVNGRETEIGRDVNRNQICSIEEQTKQGERE